MIYCSNCQESETLPKKETTFYAECQVCDEFHVPCYIAETKEIAEYKRSVSVNTLGQSLEDLQHAFEAILIEIKDKLEPLLQILLKLAEEEKNKKK